MTILHQHASGSVEQTLMRSGPLKLMRNIYPASVGLKAQQDPRFNPEAEAGHDVEQGFEPRGNFDTFKP